MLGYALRRLLLAPLVLLLLITLSFVITRLAPGNPFQSSEKPLDPAVEEGLKQRYGLDAPLGMQLLRYIGGLLPHQRPAVAATNHFEVGTAPLLPSALLTATELEIDHREPGATTSHTTSVTLADGLVTAITTPQGSPQSITIERVWIDAIRADGRRQTEWQVFDLGPSITRPGEEVSEIIARFLPPSLYLGSFALLLALLIGVSSGVISSIRHNGVFDYTSTVGAMLGLSIPTFVIGPLLLLLFERWLGWIRLDTEQTYLDSWYVFLPALILALPFAARISRLARAGMLEIINQDFVRTARAKGLPGWLIVVRHVIRGGLLPVISFLGPAVAAVLTGSLVVEKIFQLPGLGRDFVEAALSRDYTLVMGTVIVYGSFLIVSNLIADLVQAALDPRVRLR